MKLHRGIALLLSSALVATVSALQCSVTPEQLCQANGGGLLCNPCDESGFTYVVCKPEPFLHRCPPGSRWSPNGSRCQPADLPTPACTPGLHVIVPDTLENSAAAQHLAALSLPTSYGAAAARGSPFLRFPPSSSQSQDTTAQQQTGLLPQRLSSGWQYLTSGIQQVLGKAYDRVHDALVCKLQQQLVVLDSEDGRVIMELQQVREQQQQQQQQRATAWTGSLRSAMLLGGGPQEAAVVLEDHEPSLLQAEAAAAVVDAFTASLPAEHRQLQDSEPRTTPLRELAYALLQQARTQQRAVSSWRRAVGAGMDTAMRQMEHEAGGSVQAAAQLVEKLSGRTLDRTLDSPFDVEAAAAGHVDAAAAEQAQPATTADAAAAAAAAQPEGPGDADAVTLLIAADTALLAEAANTVSTMLAQAARAAAANAFMPSPADMARLTQPHPQQLQRQVPSAVGSELPAALYEVQLEGMHGAAALSLLREGSGIKLQLHDNKPVVQLLPSVLELLEYDVAQRLQEALTNQLDEMFFSQVMEVDLARDIELLLAQHPIPHTTTQSDTQTPKEQPQTTDVNEALSFAHLRHAPWQQAGRATITVNRMAMQ